MTYTQSDLQQQGVYFTGTFSRCGSRCRFVLCAQAENDAVESTVVPPVSIKEIMVGAIEPASNAVWAIALEENQPKTDEDWKATEHQAIQLLAATSAISLGGSGENDNKMARQENWQLLFPADGCHHSRHSQRYPRTGLPGRP
jgi:hypothetical protein